MGNHFSPNGSQAFGRMGNHFSPNGSQALERQLQDQRKCPCSKWGLATNLTGWLIISLGSVPGWYAKFCCWTKGKTWLVCISTFGSSINSSKLMNSKSIYKHLHILMEDPKQNFERRQLKFGTCCLLKFFSDDFRLSIMKLSRRYGIQHCDPSTIQHWKRLKIENDSCTHRIHVWCIYLHLPFKTKQPFMISKYREFFSPEVFRCLGLLRQQEGSSCLWSQSLDR